MAGKLTKAQRELLSLSAQGELEISFNHPEAAELAELGLLTLGARIFKGAQFLNSRSAKITPAGRAALQSQEPTP